MTNRQIEDKRMDQLKDPNDQHSKEISRLIMTTLRNAGNIYLGTDWHLFVRDEKGKSSCHKCKNFDSILKDATNTMTDRDMLIYLGDLADGELSNEHDLEELKQVLKLIPGKKILVLGNNDTQPISFYKACGFDYVVQSFIWSNVLFTHIPCENEQQINVHGHIHGHKTYWIPYTNQIDVAYLGGREHLVQLSQALASQYNYSKKIKEDPSKFNEGYTVPVTNEEPVLESATYIQEDPFPAE
jgi:calcineurin-like phosphoesterase family protein